MLLFLFFPYKITILFQFSLEAWCFYVGGRFIYKVVLRVLDASNLKKVALSQTEINDNPFSHLHLTNNRMTTYILINKYSFNWLNELAVGHNCLIRDSLN